MSTYLLVPLLNLQCALLFVNVSFIRIISSLKLRKIPLRNYLISTTIFTTKLKMFSMNEELTKIYFYRTWTVVLISFFLKQSGGKYERIRMVHFSIIYYLVLKIYHFEVKGEKNYITERFYTYIIIIYVIITHYITICHIYYVVYMLYAIYYIHTICTVYSSICALYTLHTIVYT